MINNQAMNKTVKVWQFYFDFVEMEKKNMDMEKVAQGFELVVANIMLLSEKLDTDFYDAFVEQNAAFF